MDGLLHVGKDGMKKKTKQWKWWIFAIFAFLIFIILQIPATWLIAKFSKDNQILHNVSGNIWQGQADWQQGQLRGSVHWKTRPLDLCSCVWVPTSIFIVAIPSSMVCLAMVLAKKLWSGTYREQSHLRH